MHFFQSLNNSLPINLFTKASEEALSENSTWHL